MVKDGDNLKLSGMIIGVAMNTQDEYQKEQYGATYTQNISEADRVAYGKKVAAQILKQVREQKGVSDDTPIVIAMYANSQADSQSALKYLPSNVPIKIIVQTANEMQAILIRKSGEKTFTTTLLD